jgi:transposase
MSRPSRKSTGSPSQQRCAPKPKSWRQCQQEYFCQRYPRLDAMEIVHRHAAGIDLGGKKSHFVALEIGQEIEVREFGMTTVQLCAMVDYLLDHEVTSVAIESTGVYWMPVCDLLEHAGIEVYLVNPCYAKNVPGRRKDDKLDCRWLQKLHKFGLLSASFRPAKEMRPLRSFIRHRRCLVQTAADYMRRLQKLLDIMNVRIHKAVSDLGGLTGMRILRALVAGEQDPVVLARLRDPHCECSEERLREELAGYMPAHLLKQLASVLRLYDGVLEELQRVDADIEAEMKALTPLPAADLAAKIAADPHKLPKGKHAPGFNTSAYVAIITGTDPTRLPGMGPQHAMNLLGELGQDMGKWPTVKHFGAFLTLAPVDKISGGRLYSSRTRPGSHPAAAIFRQAAASVVKQGGTALAGYYHNVAKRRGKPKAITALAYKLARMYYYLMKNGWAYVEVGEKQYEETYRQRRLAALQKQAKRFGCMLTPIAA